MVLSQRSLPNVWGSEPLRAILASSTSLSLLLSVLKISAAPIQQIVAATDRRITIQYPSELSYHNMAEQQADDGSTAHAKHSPASQNNMSSASHTKETIRHGLPDLDTQVSRPSTMPRSNARKRPALSSIDAPEYARLQDNALITPTSGSPMSDSNNNKVCLCQPDPKIPRPRNGVYPLPLSFV